MNYVLYKDPYLHLKEVAIDLMQSIYCKWYKLFILAKTKVF